MCCIVLCVCVCVCVCMCVENKHWIIKIKDVQELDGRDESQKFEVSQDFRNFGNSWELHVWYT